MTRDEAIKAARLGKKIRHPQFLDSEYIYWNNGLWKRHGYGTDTAENHWFCDSPFDEGWEIVKTKVKKTYWINLYHPDGNIAGAFNTSLVCSDKERLLKDKDDGDYIGTFPIEVEVEE